MSNKRLKMVEINWKRQNQSKQFIDFVDFEVFWLKRLDFWSYLNDYKVADWNWTCFNQCCQDESDSNDKIW